MMKTVIQFYDNLMGDQCVIIGDDTGTETTRLINLYTDEVMHIQDWESIPTEIIENMDFEKEFEISEEYRPALIKFIHDEIVENEENFGEDIINRQRLEWLGEDPYWGQGDIYENQN